MLAFSQIAGRPVHRTDTSEEILEYLRERGISPQLAGELGVKILPAAELIAEARGNGLPWDADTRHAIVFPHHDLQGHELLWWSARLVGRGLPPALRVVASFSDYVASAQASPSGLGKMFCPPSEPPCAYLPHGAPSSGLPKWADLKHGDRVYIHESVIKSINGALLGAYSIGLNGVWGFASKRHEVNLLTELKDIPWRALALEPVILFDTNINTSAHVQEAAKRLAMRLLEVTGRRARLLRLPPPAEGADDYGFDDFCARRSPEDSAEFLKNSALEDLELSPIELVKLELNNRCAVVESLSRVVDQESGTLMSRLAFTDLNYAHYTADVELANGDFKPVNVPKLWLSDVRRTSVRALAYEPGLPAFIARPNGTQDLNVWRGWGSLPSPGSVDPWLELLSSNVSDPLLLDWILDWLAYPLQNPGAKLTTLLLVFGPSGTGKDMFLRPIHRVYGEANSVVISNDELRSAFTSLYARKQLIHAEELRRVRDSADMVNQKIKAMVTSEKMTVNKKGDPEYKVRNVANLVITSNYYDCVKLDEDDRRSAVVHWTPSSVSSDHRGNQPYWLEYLHWADSPEGVGAIFNFLLTRDLSRFDPGAWAPATDAKNDVIDAARSPIERYVANLRDPELQDLPPLVGARCLFTSHELALYYYGEEPSKGQCDALANELRNQGFERANGGKPLHVKDARPRYYVVPRGGSPSGSLAQAPDWQNPTVCGKHLKLHGLG